MTHLTIVPGLVTLNANMVDWAGDAFIEDRKGTFNNRLAVTLPAIEAVWKNQRAKTLHFRILFKLVYLPQIGPRDY